MARSRVALSFGKALDLDLVMGERPPATTGAMVVAQDVHLILGETTTLDEVAQSAEEVAATAAQQRPRRPGSVVVGRGRGGVPLLLQAIVYDFDRTPPVREADVFEALLTAFEECRVRGLRSLAVQPVGTAHGGVAPERFLALLVQVCFSSAEMGTTLRRVHLLVASPDELTRYESLLRELLPR